MTPAAAWALTWEKLVSMPAYLLEACELAEEGGILRVVQWEEWVAAGLQEVGNAGSGSGLCVTEIA